MKYNRNSEIRKGVVFFMSTFSRRYVPKIPKRNPIARDLANRKYRAKIVPAKKGKGASYNRNKIKTVKFDSYDGFFYLSNYLFKNSLILKP